MPSTSKGLTRDAGYQVGVRRTLQVNPAEAWDQFFTPGILAIWLGTLRSGSLPSEGDFETEEGIRGRVTTCKPGSHIRMKWKLPAWEHTSILQVRLIPKQARTTIAFHQDHLQDSQQREAMKTHWERVLTDLKSHLERA